MPDPVIYVDRFRVQEGKAAEFERYAKDMAEVVERNEPDVRHYGLYLDEGGSAGTAVFVFADAAALDAHLDLVADRFEEGVALIAAAEIELLGRPSERAAELANSFGARVRTRLAGFDRP